MCEGNLASAIQDEAIGKDEDNNTLSLIRKPLIKEIEKRRGKKKIVREEEAEVTELELVDYNLNVGVKPDR